MIPCARRRFDMNRSGRAAGSSSNAARPRLRLYADPTGGASADLNLVLGKPITAA
jgi:hypothetical protein